MLGTDPNIVAKRYGQVVSELEAETMSDDSLDYLNEQDASDVVGDPTHPRETLFMDCIECAELDIAFQTLYGKHGSFEVDTQRDRREYDELSEALEQND